MTKEVYEIILKYTFDPAHKGAPYTLNGENWMNHGDLCEIITKTVLGFKPVKDGNTRYDKGSDIEEIKASVKSSKCTLVNRKLADTFEGFLDEYFRTVHSNLFIYTTITDGVATLYKMNADEFRTFIENWAGLNERGFVRFKATSGKMIAWLEGLAA